MKLVRSKVTHKGRFQLFLVKTSLVSTIPLLQWSKTPLDLGIDYEICDQFSSVFAASSCSEICSWSSFARFVCLPSSRFVVRGSTQGTTEVYSSRFNSSQPQIGGRWQS
ncbi:PREDICTED: uncharacterized protein LOC109127146 isoform X3 [Camelina sativa]|uniref:Uncharacterized protein LOC109127146 isoform X3 n=1 Tax=Camelina sativa TaxID=90675 RepID=A0ABM1QJM7_CAMSA|nr:PREDICTED: uncharacterized protein LOC109127146 isoform X3 [Camelina sativa]